MKKLLYMTLGFLILGSCGNNQKVEREQDYIETLRGSYENVERENPGMTLKIVTCTFSGDLRTPGDTIRITDWQEVYQDAEKCIAISPDDTTTLKGRTSGDLGDIRADELDMTLREAVEILRETNYMLPKTQILVIQKPKSFIHPLYVFGSGYEGWFGVDMITRKVYKF